VTRVHFETALKQVRPSIDAEGLKFYEDFERHLLRERVGRRRDEPVEAIYR